MRDAVQAALLRVQRYAQQGSAEDAARLSAKSYPRSLRSGILASTGYLSKAAGQDGALPDMRLAVQHLENPNLRGTVNAMACLIEQHGLCELQRVGVVSRGKGVYGQEILAVAKTYGIPVCVATSEGHGPNEGSGIHSREASLNYNRLVPSHSQQDDTATGIARHKAVPFPGRDHMDAIHGSGTIALEFQNLLAILAKGSSDRPSVLESMPDFVLTDMDDGLSLSGVCMALAGTDTRVVAAAPSSGFWEHASKRHTAEKSQIQSSQHKYWEGNVAPMAAIPWATFTAPGNLHGVLEVDDQQMYAASIAARDHYNLNLDPDEVVPLAVALYSEDFQRHLFQAWRGKDWPTVGILLRSRTRS